MTAATLMLRDLASAAASHPRIEQAVTAAIRTELPGVIESILREKYPGEQLTIYVAKRSASSRRDRDQAIRAEYNDSNVKALAAKYGMSVRMVFNILAPCR